MADALLRLYHNMPYFLRVCAASVRGYYLRSWRYGKETDAMIARYLEQEQWSAAEWRKWREERLAFILHRAATRVPYYRDQWNLRRRQGDHAAWDVLENWHPLAKETVRAAPLQFVADDCKLSKMYQEHTSGTTGKSLNLWWSQTTVQHWYAVFEARCRLWHGVSRADRWAILGGQLVTPVSQRHPPFWVWNVALNQLYMSSYHLAPDLIPAYLDALHQHRITYLWGYTSSLYALAIEKLRGGYEHLKIKVVLTNAEPLDDYQRRVIEDAFQCPVRETYGMAEIVAAASECQNGQMHLWPEIGQVEVFQNGNPSAPGEDGDLICTGLLNADMPLVRYQVGDVGRLASPDKTCLCGRNLPLIEKVQGRRDDVLYSADGRRIGRLDPVFKADLAVVEAQIIQETLNKIIVRFVPAAGFGPKDAQAIVERLQERMGDVEIVLERVSEIPRESNGKFRSVISKVKYPDATS